MNKVIARIVFGIGILCILVSIITFIVDAGFGVGNITTAIIELGGWLLGGLLISAVPRIRGD